MLIWIARGMLLALEVALALPLLYLAVLSVAALIGARHLATSATSSPAAVDSPRLALLVPAHDEAEVIAGLLASVAALDYPVARRDVYVIADNCTDATARIARAAGVLGVTVCERRDTAERGKGFALRWQLEALEQAGQRYDGYVFVDADSQLSANFLRVMALGLARGADAQQGQYRVQQDATSWVAGLRAIAFALFNHLRPLGRQTLGLSSGLKGNGMCFSQAVIERFGWGAYSLAEDAEQHLALVAAGVRVAYVPAAVVTSAMPTSLRQAHSQQQRWEHGRLMLARAYAAPLVRGALRERDLTRLDAIVEVCLPPLSVLAGALALLIALALVLGWAPGLAGAALLTALLALHGIAGLALARLAPRAWLALVYAPVYVLWKTGVYARAAARKGGAAWVRTPRVAAAPGEPAAPAADR
ncbi:MAG TPA: glycosyltransferase family 2 protein [Ktedonobacterales bacterium]|nr:glycosyltransferase family 2 protein [Ktedonobacterales bacterium]